jgi:flagellar basal body-associated protein FliL
MIKVWLDWFQHETKEKKLIISILLAVGVGMTLVALTTIVLVLGSQNSLKVADTHEAPINDHVSQEAHPSEPSGEHAKALPFHFPYEINQISMAMMNRQGTRTAYAMFSLVLDCPSEKALKNLSMNRAKLVDSVFDVGGNFVLEDFVAPKTPETLTKLKTQLLEKYQHSFPDEAPRDLVLKDWVIN